VYASRREQAAAALGSAAFVLGLGVALVLGLRVGWLPGTRTALVALDIQPERPPRPESKPRKHNRRSAPKDAAAPRALRNQATQIVAPPVVPLIVPPPVTTTPVAGTGNAANQGASDLPGPGQGAGGQGNGFGGGGTGGDGDGDGWAVVGPRQIRGKLTYRDLPPDLLQPGQQARVGVRYTVNPDGRVSSCTVDEPSGLRVADALTCRLIEQRFVYRPARNRDGRPVRSIIVETHTWFSRNE
jgi:periplasmic protein TonB